MPTESLPTRGVYSVKTVTRILGLSPHTLRAWERRYGAIRPERAGNGRRQYTEAELERLRLLCLLVQGGHAISTIATLPEERLRSLASYGKRNNETRLSDTGQKTIGEGGFGKVSAASDSDLLPVVAALIAALERFALGDVAAQLEWARAAFSCRSFALDIVSPLIAEVGRLVASSHLSIAQEHALSAVLRDQLGQVFRSFDYESRRRGDEGTGPRFLMTTQEGDYHEFGILLSAVLCASYRLPAHYVGPNLPAEAAASAAQALQAQIVLLGVAPLPPGELKRPLSEYLRLLDASLPPLREIWIGGEHCLRPGDLPRGRPVVLFRSLRALDERLSRLADAASRSIDSPRK